MSERPLASPIGNNHGRPGTRRRSSTSITSPGTRPTVSSPRSQISGWRPSGDKELVGRDDMSVAELAAHYSAMAAYALGTDLASYIDTQLFERVAPSPRGRPSPPTGPQALHRQARPAPERFWRPLRRRWWRRRPLSWTELRGVRDIRCRSRQAGTQPARSRAIQVAVLARGG